LAPPPLADAPVADVDEVEAVAEAGVVAGECCCWADAVCAERTERGGAVLDEPPEPQPIIPSAARPRQAAHENAPRMGIRAMLAAGLQRRTQSLAGPARTNGISNAD
jgi:hypothetical protein